MPFPPLRYNWSCVIIIFSLPPLFRSSLVRMISDYAISTESFAGHSDSVPIEFKDFLGFLIVNKIQQVGQLASSRPMYSRYGLKRDRRKLYIEPLHLPPEEDNKGRGDTSSSASNSRVTLGTVERMETGTAGDGATEMTLTLEDESVEVRDTSTSSSTRAKPVSISSFKRAVGPPGSGSASDPAEEGGARFNLAAARARASCGTPAGVDRNGNLDF